MSTHLLSRHTHRPRAMITLTRDIQLARGRTHEACGAARHSFALWLASALSGPVLWIRADWEPHGLNPDGVMDFTDPARFLFVSAQRREDQLWAVEEALRSGAVPLVVADLAAPPALTPVRRLHLAAEQGGALGPAPLALLLTPDRGGAPGIESRWHFAPRHQGSSRSWQLDRLRARNQPPARWSIQQPAPRKPLQISATAARPEPSRPDPPRPEPPRPEPPRPALGHSRPDQTR